MRFNKRLAADLLGSVACGLIGGWFLSRRSRPTREKVLAGAAYGAAYAALSRSARLPPAVGGALAGGALWLMRDELLVALGGPAQRPGTLATYVVFGATSAEAEALVRARATPRARWLRG